MHNNTYSVCICVCFLKIVFTAFWVCPHFFFYLFPTLVRGCLFARTYNRQCCRQWDHEWDFNCFNDCRARLNEKAWSTILCAPVVAIGVPFSLNSLNVSHLLRLEYTEHLESNLKYPSLQQFHNLCG